MSKDKAVADILKFKDREVIKLILEALPEGKLYDIQRKLYPEWHHNGVIHYEQLTKNKMWKAAGSKLEVCKDSYDGEVFTQNTEQFSCLFCDFVGDIYAIHPHILSCPVFSNLLHMSKSKEDFVAILKPYGVNFRF